MTKEETSQVIRFLKKIIVLGIILFLVDRGIGALIKHEYQTHPTPDAKAFRHLIKSPSEDIYIFGSSRGTHGYVSNVFTDTLNGLTCFNASHEQTNILYADVMANAILKNHTPKIAIFDMNAKETTAHAQQGSKLILSSLMMPYVNSDTSFEKLGKKLFSKEMLIAKISVLQEFNSQALPLLLGLGKKKVNRITQNGYLPIHGTKILGKLPVFEDQDEPYDPTAKDYFEDFVKKMTDKNVKVYIVQSPYYLKRFTTSPSLRELIPIIKKYNATYLDYSFDTTFFKKDYFYDNVHLNDAGAHAFSQRLASDIKADLEKNNPSLLKK